MKAADASSERLGMAAFAITVAFELVDGAFPEFYQRVSENASQSVAVEPGCLRFDVLTPVEAGASPQVFLYEIYRDRAAFDFHLASDHYRSFDLKTRDLVSKKTVWAYSVTENAKISAV
ncbi:putative quinol monooxygenase [Mesorhizobium sp. IMUNJ 23232]|uniref:putative quinol monooxygenase n=1 Tax=Mesorhizobium sp. IMUNJ 23232 TaxID=3376064 RepID=UPI0037920C26